MLYWTHLISKMIRTEQREMETQEKMTVRPETPVMTSRKQTMKESLTRQILDKSMPQSQLSPNVRV